MFANVSLCALRYLLCLSRTHLVIIETATHTPVEFAVVLVMAAAAAWARRQLSGGVKAGTSGYICAGI